MRFTQKPPLGSLINWSHPLSRGLMGCWLMNEGSGNRISDLSGNGNHGILMNGPLWAPSKFGQSLSFDGEDDYLEVADSPSLDFGAGDFSVAMWVYKRANSASWDNVWGINKWNTGGSPGTNEWFFNLTEIGDENTFLFGIEDGTTEYDVSDTATFSLNTWYHAVGVKYRTYLYIYVNGIQKNSNNIGVHSVNNVGRTVRVANSGLNDLLTDAIFDGIRIYNRALSAQEIRWLYAQPYAMFKRRPVWMDYVAAAGGLSIPVAMDIYRQRRN